MGACISSTFNESQSSAPSARVVSITGALTEYNAPVSVSKVLDTEIASSSLSKLGNYFICNSDSLSYDDYIPALNLSDNLQPNQLYFVLPKSKLQRKLAASDMAALAVKASDALQNTSKKESRRRRKAQISPVLLVNQDNTILMTSFYPDSTNNYQSDHKKIDIYYYSNPTVTKTTSSVKRLHKNTSRRAKLAVRSFRMKLGTIYEGSEQA
ncbi:hypothetical protein ACFE04_025747 [Oxalis oulophora]